MGSTDCLSGRSSTTCSIAITTISTAAEAIDPPSERLTSVKFLGFPMARGKGSLRFGSSFRALRAITPGQPPKIASCRLFSPRLSTNTLNVK